MTTLDQVHLLEEKVERAVEKLQQLQAENDALRNKCAELTNALSSKTEQLSSFTTDKNQIEDGIKKALDRLSYIENSVLKAGAVSSKGQEFSSTITSKSIQITPGVSKINEEQLSQVTQNNTVSLNSNVNNPPNNNVSGNQGISNQGITNQEQIALLNNSNTKQENNNNAVVKQANIPQVNNMTSSIENIDFNSMEKVGNYNQSGKADDFTSSIEEPEFDSNEEIDQDDQDGDGFGYDIF